VRYWPVQSRDWGHAAIAELHQIHDSREALRWACGGIFVFLRAVGLHLLNWALLPPGAKSVPGALGLDGTDRSRNPKHSRLITALLLAATALLLLLPPGREAISDVCTTTKFFIRSNSEWNDAEALAKQGEKENDAHKLAFAAISHPDPSRELQLASKAVLLDPSLTWVYADSFHRMNDTRGALSEDLYHQLIARDPDNGYLYLLRASELHNSKDLPRERNHLASLKAYEESFTDDPQWLSLMEKGIAAPRYDSYARDRGELGRELWNRDNSIPPYLIVSSLWHVPIPDFDQLNIYLNFRIREAKALMASGQILQADRSLQELSTFGRRMVSSNQTAFETAMGADISIKAMTELHSFYVTSQRSEEAATAAPKLDELEAQREAIQAVVKKSFESPSFDLYRRKAIHVLLCIVALLISGLALAIGLGTLEWSSVFSGNRKKWARSVACFVADYAPLALLLACADLIYSFRPFATAFAHYRSGCDTITEVRFLSEVLLTLGSVFAPRLPDHATYYAWWTLTILLSLCALMIILRRLYNSFRLA
jgi:hypothetical protein